MSYFLVYCISIYSGDRNWSCELCKEIQISVDRPVKDWYWAMIPFNGFNIFTMKGNNAGYSHKHPSNRIIFIQSKFISMWFRQFPFKCCLRVLGHPILWCWNFLKYNSGRGKYIDNLTNGYMARPEFSLHRFHLHSLGMSHVGST